MKPTGPQGVVFDFDGVIVDTERLHYRAIHDVALRHGAATFDYATYLRDYIGFDDREAFTRLLGHRADLAALLEEKADTFDALVHHGVAPIPGVDTLIRELIRAGWRLAIGSGARRRDILPILDRLGLRDAFPLIVSADDVAHSKPDPTTYRLAVERIGLPSGACVAIEDTAAGIASARGAGLWTVGITTTGSAADLATAHRVVASMQEITPNTLQQWFDTP